MRLRNILFIGFIGLTLFFSSCTTETKKETPIPRLEKKQGITRLMVNNQPYLILGGELGNSSASSIKYMDKVWDKLTKQNLNTVLLPVYWEQIEKEEGIFDFSVIEGIITKARKHDLKLVLLWFGAWKNSMSSYAPAWVKKDSDRFPRAITKEGKAVEILSPFSEKTLEADKKAFCKLMLFIKEIDKTERTVLMVQVENEIGMIYSARDHSILAEKYYNANVPSELINYLKENYNNLIPEFKAKLDIIQLKESSWESVFGKNIYTDELFMAWYFSSYVNKLAIAGKEIYPLPMYVNAALNHVGYEPGQYPSAGPLPHIMDIWKAGAPIIDFLSPDIYYPVFETWCEKYARNGNPLFIPEAGRGSLFSKKVFYAVGEHHCFGFCPFSIESTNQPKNEEITKAYDILNQLQPLVLKSYSKEQMRGIVVSQNAPYDTLSFGDYNIIVKHDYTWGWSTPNSDKWPDAACIIIKTENEEFYVGGTGVILNFYHNKGKNAGILNIHEGEFKGGKWKPGRWLNGDESHQGRHVRIPMNEWNIQRFELYAY